MGVFPHPNKSDPKVVARVLELRKQGLSFVNIAKDDQVTVSREMARQYCWKHFPEEELERAERLKTLGKYRNIRRTKKYPRVATKFSIVTYDFLQYMRIVRRWARTSGDILPNDLDMLLYVYPKGFFTKRQFYDYHRIIGIYQDITFTRMRKEGWITLWRTYRGGKKKEAALYTVTNKGKQLCNKMHKMCLGEIEIPTTQISKNEDTRQHGYILNAIKKINKERRE